MSMYTQLLDAAYGQRAQVRDDEGQAVAELRRCRTQLEEGVPPGVDLDTVPAVLALQLGYDVALLVLAELVGVDTDPSRFEQPQRERARVEHALNERGISLRPLQEDASAGA